MSLSDIFETFLQMDGQKFQVERNRAVIASYDGLTNTKDDGTEYIGFRPNADIQPNDWLINDAGDRFFVKSKQTEFVLGKPNQLMVYYDTEFDYNNKNTQTSSTIFNITNANGSVIGNHNNASISYVESLSNIKNEVQNSNSPDKEELQEIVTLLEMLVNNKIPASKGLFSKFSEVMERNSWITGSIASTILSWLINYN